MLLKDFILALVHKKPFTAPVNVEGDHAGIVIFFNHELAPHDLLKTARIAIHKYGNIPVVFAAADEELEKEEDKAPVEKAEAPKPVPKEAEKKPAPKRKTATKPAPKKAEPKAASKKAAKPKTEAKEGTDK